jgi:peptide/nickel transport system permease protein
MTVIDLLLVLPSFLIIAILSPTFRGRTWLIFVVLLATFQWMITARTYWPHAVASGTELSTPPASWVCPAGRSFFRHILPNMASLLIIDATINVSSLILAEVGLFLWLRGSPLTCPRNADRHYAGP